MKISHGVNDVGRIQQEQRVELALFHLLLHLSNLAPVPVRLQAVVRTVSGMAVAMRRKRIRPSLLTSVVMLSAATPESVRMNCLRFAIGPPSGKDYRISERLILAYLPPLGSALDDQVVSVWNSGGSAPSGLHRRVISWEDACSRRRRLRSPRLRLRALRPAGCGRLTASHLTMVRYSPR